MKFVFYSVLAVIAVVAAMVSLRFSEQETKQPAPAVTQNIPVREINIETAQVLVAKNNISVGTIIDSSMVDAQPWPKNLVLASFITGEMARQEVIGKVVRSSIQAGEPFIKSKLANPNDPGFLAAALPPGMHAITISTDAISGIAGFIFPGDRVDILFAHSIEGGKSKGIGRASTAEVLGSNIKVLAVNLRSPDPNSPPPVSPNSVTVEVNEELAQRIRLAEKNGTLSLSLRSIYDNGTDIPNPTGIGSLSNMSAPSPSLLVVRGPGQGGGEIRSSDVTVGAVDSASSAAVRSTDGGDKFGLEKLKLNGGR
ncbi:MAG: Flp pilus assembly protein CpaB [Rickettsiales bacterium]